jgi:wobble nucleotide-excising tRNase
MSNTPTIRPYGTLSDIAKKLRREDLQNRDFVLFYAYNGTGKTRLSMEFKNVGKQRTGLSDTLYFNAFTEDLFSWENDFENDSERFLKINANSNFFSGFKALSLEVRIEKYLQRYASFDFNIDYENWRIVFKQGNENSIKISRGEENLFIWCIFLAICEVTLDGDESYNWVRYFYIDDPISSLDDNNAIAIASDLAKLLKEGKGKIKTVVSSHHALFFNVICNELKKEKPNQYFLHKKNDQGYTLQKTNDTPFFHHVALLVELKQVSDSGNINTYHFNVLRTVLEKTAKFFGFNDFSACIDGVEDEVLFARALNLLSHGAYSIYQPVEMGADNKTLFKRILQAFLEKYHFELPQLLEESTTQQQPE